MSSSLDDILSKYVATDGEYKDKVQALGLIVVDKNGKTLYSKSLGRQTLASDLGTFTHDSVCWIASMTKIVTAVACVQIIEKGLIGVDDDVSTIVPELRDLQVLTGFDAEGKPILEDKTKPITLRTLLTHSSGFCYHVFEPLLLKYCKAVGKPIGTYKTMQDYTFPLKFQPGEGWNYGVGCDWAGHVVEVLTKTSLEEFFQQHIFQPLGMTSTTLRLQDHPELQTRRAEIGHRDPQTGSLVSKPDEAPSVREVMGGGGGLFSTTADYAKLLTSLITNDGKLLKPASLTTLLAPSLNAVSREAFQRDADAEHGELLFPSTTRKPQVSYALGGAVNLGDVPGKRREGSVRWGGMTNPNWWIDPKSGIAVVTMAQTLPPGDKVVNKLSGEVEKAIYEDLLG